ncbi:DUF1934 domain-containing protein [Desulfosporosinus fructosivorans]|uniref:DUF1934 domain-containing protein n=1 Tax=Desulfosporosinus fructosivorans TaxID=2018669 RepID=A0A4Z0R1J0_9FIRM|nr:DUF1934 domain-containing protein [Desulfosporosinus fructosivorans]TGE36600.1 DUF1934 domain-containing protein [Desulfosporosinus fructosivorans]
MQKKVTIQIKGSQKYPEGHVNQQELNTVGTYYERNGVFYLVYKDCDSENTEFEGVTTFITVKHGLVGLNRKGAVDNRQEFNKGVLNRGIYSTCFGKIWLSVMPHLVECDLTVQGGRISLEYDLFVEDNLISYNVLLLNIKEDFPQ